VAVAVVVRGGTHVLSMAPVKGAPQAVFVARSSPVGSGSDCIIMMLRPATPRTGSGQNAETIASQAPPDRVIVLNCFGRGGSGIVWRMIGSSPDVIMTAKEWHVGVFGEKTALRKGLVLAFRSLGIRSIGPLRSYASRKTLEMQRQDDLFAKSDAGSIVIKLMDYHITFSQMIGSSFAHATFINLERHPYGQCESLMRSGLSLKDACGWYCDVVRMMLGHAGPGTIRVRFEDVVTRPIDTCEHLYKALGVRWAEDHRFEFKVKPYGADRRADVGVEDKEFIRIGKEDARDHIDASVLRGETERLSSSERRAIWELTGACATRLGYAAAGTTGIWAA
jgi:Sulfotransferase family